MTALYNENDPFAANWLENLAHHDRIAQGPVDRRSIAELAPSDVAGHGQRHFFAGIGGWSLALRLAGVPDAADVWTGSCPCQPFSDAGKGGGVLDARHLWPAWFALIRECRPPIIFGEQVASADGLGWLDLVFADLERCGYAVGAADLCAAGVGAPHQRQRLFFVAFTPGDRRLQGLHAQLPERGPGAEMPEAHRRGDSGVVADSGGAGPQDRRTRGATLDRGPAGGAANPDRQGSGTRRVLDVGFWADADWILCRSADDGPPVARPVEPGAFPLAHGVPGRVGLLRGYGNAIVTQVAAEFIRASLEAIKET